MESNKRVGLVVVVVVAAAAMVLVSTFFIPTVFTGLHKNYGVVSAAAAETDSDEYENTIMVKGESSRSTAAGSKRLEADKGCPSSECTTISTSQCKMGCFCVPYVPFTTAGVCIGICCQTIPPPGPPPSLSPLTTHVVLA